jgi:hypothetical protein
MTMPLILLVVLVGIALAAPRYGADSRDSADWNPARRYDEPPPTRRRHTVGADLVTLGHVLGAFARRVAGGTRGAGQAVGHSQYPRAKTSTG